MTVTKFPNQNPPKNPPDEQAPLDTFVCRAMKSALSETAAHPQEGITVITGSTGIGKTHGISAWVSWVSEDEDLPDLNPVVWQASPLTGGAQTGMVSLCEALGEQTRDKGGYLYIAALRRLEVLRSRTVPGHAIVVIDEAQFLTVELLDQMRCVWELSGIGLALVGNAKLARTVQQLVSKEPQIRRRFGTYLQLDLADADIDLFCRKWGLTSQAIRRARDFARLGGGLGTLSYLLPKAARLRASDRLPIDLPQLEMAAAKMGLNV